jgi:hypothetical protein
MNDRGRGRRAIGSAVRNGIGCGRRIDMTFARFTIGVLALLLCSAGMATAQYVNQGDGRLVPQQGRGGDTVTVLYRDGVEFLKKGECKDAEKKFLKVLDAVPRNSEANYLCGVALQCQKDFDGSVRYFRRAKRDDAHFYRAYEALGISALALGSREHAQRELDALDEFVGECGKKCPPILVRSRQKLVDAIAKFDGVPVEVHPKSPTNQADRTNEPKGEDAPDPNRVP